ncbi:hypothetical protein BC831DRAFT_484439 [Entophlyctis helioformis]|nr:hypothetical protein BC831DRAFT_484439 [Entophlyctis helioformis]
MSAACDSGQPDLAAGANGAAQAAEAAFAPAKDDRADSSDTDDDEKTVRAGQARAGQARAVLPAGDQQQAQWSQWSHARSVSLPTSNSRLPVKSLGGHGSGTVRSSFVPLNDTVAAEGRHQRGMAASVTGSSVTASGRRMPLMAHVAAPQTRATTAALAARETGNANPALKSRTSTAIPARPASLAAPRAQTCAPSDPGPLALQSDCTPRHTRDRAAAMHETVHETAHEAVRETLAHDPLVHRDRRSDSMSSLGSLMSTTSTSTHSSTTRSTCASASASSLPAIHEEECLPTTDRHADSSEDDTDDAGFGRRTCTTAGPSGYPLHLSGTRGLSPCPETSGSNRSSSAGSDKDGDCDVSSTRSSRSIRNTVLRTWMPTLAGKRPQLPHIRWPNVGGSLSSLIHGGQPHVSVAHHSVPAEPFYMIPDATVQDCIRDGSISSSDRCSDRSSAEQDETRSAAQADSATIPQRSIRPVPPIPHARPLSPMPTAASTSAVTNGSGSGSMARSMRSLVPSRSISWLNGLRSNHQTHGVAMPVLLDHASMVASPAASTLATPATSRNTSPTRVFRRQRSPSKSSSGNSSSSGSLPGLQSGPGFGDNGISSAISQTNALSLMFLPKFGRQCPTPGAEEAAFASSSMPDHYFESSSLASGRHTRASSDAGQHTLNDLAGERPNKRAPYFGVDGVEELMLRSTSHSTVLECGEQHPNGENDGDEFVSFNGTASVMDLMMLLLLDSVPDMETACP